MQKIVFIKLNIFFLLTVFNVMPLMASSDDAKKIGVCHNIASFNNQGKLVFVSKNALPGHLNHGDSTRFIVLKDKVTCKKLDKEERRQKK